AAQGRPWIFREVDHFLRHGTHLPPPTWGELHDCLLDHLEDHYTFYGEHTGVRSARKHIGWYLEHLPGGRPLVQHVYTLDTTDAQRQALIEWFGQKNPLERLPDTP